MMFLLPLRTLRSLAIFAVKAVLVEALLPQSFYRKVRKESAKYAKSTVRNEFKECCPIAAAVRPTSSAILPIS